MENAYVEQHDGGYWIKGTRVSLDSVVYRFLEGLSPESIQADCFPALTLEQVYGAITYYLHNKAEVDAYRERGRKIEDAYYQEYLERGPYFLRDDALAGRPERRPSRE